MNIQIRLPSALLLVSLCVLAAASPAAAQPIASGSNQTFGAGRPPTASSAIPPGPDRLQRVLAGVGGATAASDSRTIQILAPTMASAANQVFTVGQVPAAISAITVTETAVSTITAAKDLRIRIPPSVNMTWNTALSTATITGVAAGKVLPIVSYEDGGKTLVLDVAIDFAAGDQIVVDGLQYQNFTAPSAADYLQLVVTGAG